jgi:hypothetical protein
MPENMYYHSSIYRLYMNTSLFELRHITVVITHILKLQIIQNIIRQYDQLRYQNTMHLSASPIFKTLGILIFNEIYNLQLITFMYMYVANMLPAPLMDSCILYKHTMII